MHFFPKIWLKKSPCVLHCEGKVRIFPESDLLKWGASYMPVRPICCQIRYINCTQMPINQCGKSNLKYHKRFQNINMLKHSMKHCAQLQKLSFARILVRIFKKFSLENDH